MLQPFPLGFSQTIVDGAMIRTGSIVADNVAARTITTALIAAGAITANEILAGSINATKLSVGQHLSYTSRASAGSGFSVATDGSFTAPLVPNATDAEWMANNTVFHSAPNNAFNPVVYKLLVTGQCGIIFGLANAPWDTTLQNGVGVLWKTDGSVSVNTVAGVNSYTPVWSTALAAFPIATVPATLKVEHYDTSTGAYTYRLKIYINGVRVAQLTDAQLGTASGARGGYAAIKIGAASKISDIQYGRAGIILEDGTVTAAAIRAGSISADKLAIGENISDDLLINPIFANGTSDWYTAGGVVNPVSNLADAGFPPTALWMEAGSYAYSGYRSSLGLTDDLQFIRMRAGDGVYLSTTIKGTAASAMLPLLLGVETKNDSGLITYTELARSTGTLGWITLAGTFTLPSTAQKIRMRLDVGAGVPAAGEHWWATNCVFQKQVSSVIIQDGAVSANKILASSITADRIMALAITADRIAANTITADKLAVGQLFIGHTIQSSIYTGGTTSAAPAGFKLSSTPYNTTYIGAAAPALTQGEFGASLNIAGYPIGEAIYRSLNMFDMTPYTVGATGWGFYKGNINRNSLGGAPNIACLWIANLFTSWTNATIFSQWNYKVQGTSSTLPNGATDTDNIDCLTAIEVMVYDSTGVGPRRTQTISATGRNYANHIDLAHADNAAKGSMDVMYRRGEGADATASPTAANEYYTNAYCCIRLWNIYGPSAWRYYAGADLFVWNNGGVAAPVGAPAPAPGGGGGAPPGSSCPVPETLVLMSDFTYKPIGSIRVGEFVFTEHEETGKWGFFEVIGHSFSTNTCAKVVFDNGVSLTASSNHRLLSETGWKELRDMQPGDRIKPSGTQVVSVVPVGVRTVVKMTVASAHTYVTEGMVSHNAIKLITL